jgi:hypothetical protein
VPHTFVNMLLPIGGAVIALCTALAGYVMVKFFGVIFLGQPRELALARAHDAGLLEKLGMVWLAAGCLLLGVLPVQVIAQLSMVSRDLLGVALPAGDKWWLLVPLDARASSYGPLLILLVGLAVMGLTALLVHGLYHRRLRRAPAWDCGFERIDTRMQDTAEGFGQPIRHIFQPFFLISRELPSPFDTAPRYAVTVIDRVWRIGYEPVGRVVRRLADFIAIIQQGRIATYLLYSFVTLIVLLALVL